MEDQEDIMNIIAIIFITVAFTTLILAIAMSWVCYWIDRRRWTKYINRDRRTL